MSVRPSTMLVGLPGRNWQHGGKGANQRPLAVRIERFIGLAVGYGDQAILADVDYPDREVFKDFL